MLATRSSRPTPEGASPERILIVDSDWLTASAIRHALETAGHVISDVASSSDEAVASASREVPDLAVVQIPTERWEDGAELVQRLRSHFGVPSVIITSGEGQTRVIGSAAAGIVVKPFHESQLLGTIAVAYERRRPSGAVVGPGAVMGPGAVVRPRNAAASSTGSAPAVPAAGDRSSRFREVARKVAQPASDRSVLTPRELEVVRLLLDNGRVRTIAEQLHRSPATVRNQLNSVFRKLGVHSQAELILRLKEQG